MRKRVLWSSLVRWAEGIVCHPCEYPARPPHAVGHSSEGFEQGVCGASLAKRNLSSAYGNCLRVFSSLPAPFSPPGCPWLWGQALTHALYFSWGVLNRVPPWYF